MNLEESIPKKFKKELTLLRKGNFRLTFSYCEDIYNAGRFNFTVMEWAIKEIIKEEREEEELKRKVEEAEKRARGE